MSSKKKIQRQITLIKQTSKTESPEVVIEENFKIVDYTQVLKNIKDITEIKRYFVDYKPTDIRCVKRKHEGKQDHSHVMVSFNQFLHGEIVGEVGLITDYSLYGFAISIGEMSELKKICHLNTFELEFLLLPKADNQDKLSLADVIEWAYEHKDEQYMNPCKMQQLNMGKRIFTYISSILTINRSNSRI